MNKLGTVIRFTYGSQIKRKSFLISTLVFALIISLLANLPSIIEMFNSDKGPDKVGYVAGDQAVLEHMQSYYTSKPEAEIEIVPVSSEEEARRLVEEKEIKGYLLASGETNVNGVPSFQYKSQDTMPTIIGKLSDGLQFANQTIARQGIGLTDDQISKLFAPVALEPVQINNAATDGDGGKTESEVMLAYILVYVLLFMLYIGVIGYGNTVATEITAEKSSRVMELLVSSVSPLTQMFGKIIGICLLGLTQIALFLAVGAANIALMGDAEFFSELNLNLSEIDPMLIVYFLIFYLLGYFIYATVFAAAGSLVSRTEEVAQVIMPVTLLIVVVFFIAFYGLQNPNAPIIVTLSYVPFFSPMLMFLRIGMSDPAVWEIWLSILLSVAGTYAMGWLAAKIYRTGVLMYGKLPSFKELRKAMKAYDM